MRYKAHVIIEFDADPNGEHLPNYDPDDDLEGLLSQMDEVGRQNLDYTIVSTKLINKVHKMDMHN